MRKSAFFLFFIILFLPLLGQRRWGDNGIPVSSDFSFAENHLSATDGAGGAIVAWMDNGAEGYGMYAQRLNGRGNRLWTENGVGVYTGSPVGDSFAMVADGAAGVIFAWHDYRMGSDDIFAQRIDASGNKLWGDVGTPVCIEAHGQISPRLAADGSGGAIFVWDDFRLGSLSDIFAQRLDANGNSCWAADGIPICMAANGNLALLAIGDDAGGAIIIWDDYRLGTDANIFAQRVNGAGNVLWPENGTAVCSAPAVQALPKAVADRAHGAIIAWSDVRSGLVEIYAQRIDSSGNGIWPANGIPIASRSNDQYEAVIAGDGSGGAMIAWSEPLYHDASYHDIYAQRLDPYGNPLWTAAGIPVCIASEDQTGPNLVADPSGGAIIAWTDGRNLGPTRKICASMLDAQGAPRWRENGIQVSLNDDSQYQPRLISDGQGGAIVIWQDVGNIVSSIYAQRLSPVFSVHFIAAKGGNIEGDARQRVFFGESCSPVRAVPHHGYGFRDWSGTGNFHSTTNPLRLTRVNEDMTVQANFVNILPDVSILYPLNNATVWGSINIQARASSGNAIREVEFYVDGRLLGIHNRTSFACSKTGREYGVGTYSSLWDTTAYGNGPHAVRFKALDASGLSAACEVTVMVANVMITLQAQRMQASAWIIRKYYGKIDFNVWNPGLVAVAKYTIYRKVNASEYQALKEIAPSLLQDNVFRFNDVYLEKEMKYTYQIAAFDADGNVIGVSNESAI